MLEDIDFEFPKMESKLDRVRVAWDNFSNDKEKSKIKRVETKSNSSFTVKIL